MLMNRETAHKRWHIRPDGPDKVTGKLRYLTDLTVPGMVYGKVLRSVYPHARIVAIHAEQAERLEGVYAVITYKDVPGLNGFGIVNPDQPVLCEDRVRYVGDAVAAVAAESKELAEYALSLIEVKYEPLPVITSPEQALHADAPLLHKDGNILHTTSYKRGDIEEAFASCKHVIEDTYHTPRQMHAYMETEGGLFMPEEEGRLTIYAATQHGYKDRMQLSRILDIPEEHIRVISSPIGGSFGGKDELNVQPYGALLALKSGMPVKMHNSRKESVIAGLKRHPMAITMKTGLDAGGKLVAHQVRIVADTGAYSTLGGPVLSFATEHAMGPYSIANVDVEGVSVFTNNGVSGEFRGFGGNQVIFALETQIDRLAEAAGLDPWELRKLNLRQPDDLGPFGQRIVHNEGASLVWNSVEQSELWQHRSKLKANPSEPWLRKGIGAAIAMHGSGLGSGIPDPGGGRLRLNADGKLEVAFGFEEFGQGITAALELMMMDFFHCYKGDVRVVIGDTDLVPHTGSSTASRSTTVAYMALKKMQPSFTDKLLTVASAASGYPKEALMTGPEGIWLTSDEEAEQCVISYQRIAELGADDFTVHTSFEFPTTPDSILGGHYLYTCTAVVAQVEVNTLTGQIKLLDTHHAVAAGPAVNPMGYIGQIEGGSLMALGFTLCEDAIIQEGHYMTQNLDTYMIPTIGDMPSHFTLDAIERLPADDPFGPRGVGEIGTVALAPAITSAVHHAIGKWISRLPIRREEVMECLADSLSRGVTAS